jgi:hypothetical protein
MDDKTHMDAESASGLTVDNAGSFSWAPPSLMWPCLTSAESRYDGAFFSGAQRFTVAGGTFNNFNNVTNNYTTTPIVPSGTLPPYLLEGY